MDDFLSDYVFMLAETKGYDINEKQLEKIVNNLANNENLWDIFDGYIFDELEKGV